MKELRMLCAEDEQSRSCWMTAFRIFKVILQCLHRSTANVISSILFVPSNLLIVCNTSNLMAFIHYYVPFPLQYGIVLYQNYKIPQQRKTLLSHFSAPVVSLLE